MKPPCNHKRKEVFVYTPWSQSWINTMAGFTLAEAFIDVGATKTEFANIFSKILYACERAVLNPP